MLGIFTGLMLLAVVNSMSCSVRIGPKIVKHHGKFVAARYEEASFLHNARIVVVIDVVDGFTKESRKKLFTATQGVYPESNFERLWTVYYLSDKGHIEPGDKITVEFQE
jgi:hypothetical protein